MLRQSKSSSSPSSNEEPTSKPMNSLANYHLIWSPKVLQKVALTTLSLWITNRSVNWNNVLLLQSLDWPWHNWHAISWLPTTNTLVFNLVLPTLSSACCWIQLLLNVMVTAMGCAGFNTFLGPLRPFFLSVLLYWTLVARHHTTMVTHLLRWMIALLPEVVHFWNTNRHVWLPLQRQLHRNQTTTTATMTATMISTPNQGTTHKTVSVYLDCPSMGCVACIQKVESSLRKVSIPPGSSIGTIDSAQSWLLDGGTQKGGKAKVTLSFLPTIVEDDDQNHYRKTSKKSGDDDDDNDNDEVDPKIIAALVHAVEAVGFPCTVDQVRTESTTTG